MFKKISWIVALIAALAMVFMGCPEDEKYGKTDFVFTLEGEAIVLESWGSNAPDITKNQVAIEASSSTGFTIDFGKLVTGYVYNKNAKVVFTYEIVDLTTPEAVLTVKNSAGWADTAGDSGYGIGNGREFFLGSELTGGDLEDGETASNYGGPITEGTYNKETKVGTFEVYLRHLMGLTKIGFQHNVWAEFDDNKVAEDSKYTVKFTKIQSFPVAAVDLPPEPPAYIISNLNTSFTWTTVGVTNTVVNLGAPQITDPKPRWEITTATTPVAYSAFTVASKAPKNILIVLGDISESAVGYLQIATQYFEADNLEGGGKGWANHQALSGGSPFPEISPDGVDAGATWDATNKILTIPVLADFAKYLTDDVTDVSVGGFVLYFNAGGEKNFDIVAIGIEYE